MGRHPLLLLGVAAALSAAVEQSLHAPSLAPQFRAHTTRVACSVLADVAQENGLDSYPCAVDGGPTLAVSGAGTPPQTGMHVWLRGRIEPFDPPRNPGEPDERLIQSERGLAARLSGTRILRVLPPAQLTLALALARAHAWASRELRMRLPELSATILAGELWGERGSLPPELRAEFQETGTIHVLVTAGLHLGVVAALVLALLRALTLPRAIACAVAIAALWSYALFSGLHLPAMRAATMISFALAAYACGRAARSSNVFGVALLTIAIFDPQAVTSASFVLSFSCVGAILLCVDPIDAVLQQFGALPVRLREALTVTLATQLGTWPLTASLFLLFSPYAVLANLAIVPCVGTTMILGALQLAFAHVPQLAQAIANVNGWLLAWIVAVVHTLSAMPGASIAAMPPPVWSIAVYDCLLIAAIYLWKNAGRTPALALFLFGVLLVAAPPRAIDHRLRITVLDVGQADAIVIRTPLDHTLMVDAGGKLEQGRGTESSAERVGERIVVPFLRREGVRAIDALILSHPHGDHAGGMAPVLRAIATREFADSGQRYPGFAYNDALQTARGEHVPIVYPRSGMVWRTSDGVTLTFIGPSLPLLTNTRNDINNNSIAFILQYKHFRMLFTGDAGAEAEHIFLSEGIDLHADVLKVGHHGSAYSSTPAFIAAVHPRFAIISVGRHNMFGHPAPSTLETLQRFGTQIYRTDENGAVTVSTNGQMTKLSVMATAGPRLLGVR